MRDAKELFAKEMTRKQFLQLIGVAIVGALGVANFISLLSRTSTSGTHSKVTSEQSSSGFGSRKFGV